MIARPQPGDQTPETWWPSARNSGGHQQGELISANKEKSLALDTARREVRSETPGSSTRLAH